MASKISPAQRRLAEKQALREQILEAARRLFASQGYEATTMRAIAEDIAYAPAAIYYHFKDKQEIVRELCNRDFSELTRRCAPTAALSDPMLRLFILGQAYVEFALRHPEQYKFMFMTPKPRDWELGPDDQQRGNPHQDGYAFLEHTAAECIASGRVRDDLTDPILLAQVAWSAMYGVVGIHLAMGNDPHIRWAPVRQLALETALTLMRGIAAKPKRESAKVLETFATLFDGTHTAEEWMEERFGPATGKAAPIERHRLPNPGTGR